MFKKLIASLLLVLAFVAPAAAFNCGVDEPTVTLDLVGPVYTGADGINDIATIAIQMVSGDNMGKADIKGIAIQQCANLSGGCGPQSPVYCTPAANCSYITGPFGTLGGIGTYEPIGVQDLAPFNQFRVSIQDSADAPAGGSGVSVRYRVWLTKDAWATYIVKNCADQ